MSTISVLNKDWRGVSIDMTGPDGTEVIGRVVFLVCPLCSGMIPPAIEEVDYAEEHAKKHIKEAQDWDHVNRVLEILTRDADQQAGG